MKDVIARYMIRQTGRVAYNSMNEIANQLEESVNDNSTEASRQMVNSLYVDVVNGVKENKMFSSGKTKSIKDTEFYADLEFIYKSLMTVGDTIDKTIDKYTTNLATIYPYVKANANKLKIYTSEGVTNTGFLAEALVLLVVHYSKKLAETVSLFIVDNKKQQTFEAFIKSDKELTRLNKIVEEIANNKSLAELASKKVISDFKKDVRQMSETMDTNPTSSMINIVNSNINKIGLEESMLVLKYMISTNSVKLLDTLREYVTTFKYNISSLGDAVSLMHGIPCKEELQTVLTHKDMTHNQKSMLVTRIKDIHLISMDDFSKGVRQSKKKPTNLVSQLTETTLTSKAKAALDDSEFGIPTLRKYPLCDKEHVLSAIKFFFSAEEDNKSILASNIKVAADKFNINLTSEKILKYLPKVEEEL